MILYTKEQKIEILKCLVERLDLTVLDPASISFLCVIELLFVIGFRLLILALRE